MNKNDLIAAVAEKSGLGKVDSMRAVEAVLEAVVDSLKQGGDVRLVGFGTFSVAHRSETKGRNPQTGEPITIPAQKQAKFKAGKALKESLN